MPVDDELDGDKQATDPDIHDVADRAVTREEQKRTSGGR